MAAITITSQIPHGTYAFLKRIRDGATSPAYHATAKARAFCRRQDWVICHRDKSTRTAANGGWTYELTETGRRALADIERQDALDL
jgi:hypothetical protein